jgi:hypothetical protein
MSIDINKINESIDLIKKTIESNQYEKSIKYILDSKNLILNHYNVFSFIDTYISKFEIQNKNKKKKATIRVFQEMWLRKQLKKILDKIMIRAIIKNKLTL